MSKTTGRKTVIESVTEEAEIPESGIFDTAVATLDTANSDDVDAILQRVAEFDKKAMALRTKALDVKANPHDIYSLDIKRPESSCVYVWKNFHGKCIEAGMAKYKKWGYTFYITSHIDKDNKDFSRTKCEHCGKVLNEKLAAELIKEHAEQFKQRKVTQQRRIEYKQELELEAVLLGKL